MSEWLKVIKDAMGKEINTYSLKDCPSPFELDKLYGAGKYTVWARKDIISTGTAVASEDSSVSFFRNLAHPETIMAALARLAMHKQTKGTELERAFILKDYTQRFVSFRVKEIDLFDAIEEIITEDQDQFFPTYAKIHRKVFGTSERKTFND